MVRLLFVHPYLSLFGAQNTQKTSVSFVQNGNIHLIKISFKFLKCFGNGFFYGSGFYFNRFHYPWPPHYSTGCILFNQACCPMENTLLVIQYKTIPEGKFKLKIP